MSYDEAVELSGFHMLAESNQAKRGSEFLQIERMIDRKLEAFRLELAETLQQNLEDAVAQLVEVRFEARLRELKRELQERESAIAPANANGISANGISETAELSQAVEVKELKPKQSALPKVMSLDDGFAHAQSLGCTQIKGAFISWAARNRKACETRYRIRLSDSGQSFVAD